LDALELALEGPRIGESVAVNDLHCAKLSQNIACQPDIAVAPAADAPEQLVLRDVGRGRSDTVVGGRRPWRCGR